jgi:hypothetical protein
MNKFWRRIWSIVLLLITISLFNFVIESPDIFGTWTWFVSFFVVFFGTLGYFKILNLLKTFKWNKESEKWEEIIKN